MLLYLKLKKEKKASKHDFKFRISSRAGPQLKNKVHI